MQSEMRGGDGVEQEEVGRASERLRVGRAQSRTTGGRFEGRELGAQHCKGASLASCLRERGGSVSQRGQ